MWQYSDIWYICSVLGEQPSAHMYHPPWWFLVEPQLHFTVGGAVSHIKTNEEPCYICCWYLRDLNCNKENCLIFVTFQTEQWQRQGQELLWMALLWRICSCWGADIAVPMPLSLPSLLGNKGNCEVSSLRKEAVLLGELGVTANYRLPNPVSL